ncbi:hypothetical protein [Roseovarius salis]|uniref:hypothetical protein n=1 Tax=Roseovarius salis TaxID=3376063 RepID=UPI0037C95F89
MKHVRLALILAFVTATPGLADAPRVLGVAVEKAGMVWNVRVTLAHPDSGWDHYADGWEVLGPDGNRIGFRELMHPHVHEQPFTRSLSGVMLPDGARRIFIRPRCSRDGWSEEAVEIELRP